MTPLRTLILGGTTEAMELVDALRADMRFQPILSLAGVTRSPRLPSIESRVGGFGGAMGLTRYLQQRMIHVLIVATHPFAAQIRNNAVAAARAVGCPLLILLRPPWRAQSGDQWLPVPDARAAAEALGVTSRRVLLTIGRKELAAFASQPHHRYVVRTIDPPAPEDLPAGAELVSARGPFSEADERSLIETRGIEILVTKNSGGAATAAKLSAARACQLPVVMIERPPIPALEGTRTCLVNTTPEALYHLEAQHHTLSSTDRGV